MEAYLYSVLKKQLQFQNMVSARRSGHDEPSTSASRLPTFGDPIVHELLFMVFYACTRCVVCVWL